MGITRAHTHTHECDTNFLSSFGVPQTYYLPPQLFVARGFSSTAKPKFYLCVVPLKYNIEREFGLAIIIRNLAYFFKSSFTYSYCHTP